MKSPDYLQISAEVATALHEGAAVVALESTIIAHGMPYPANAETARRVEDTIRSAGAVPATIAIMDGQLKVGLSPTEIERLAKQGTTVAKASRRDLAFLLQQNAMGATTVAATMIIAQMAGIRVFATGGIGGVHRGAERTLDISADLQELARTEVAVVSAGAKSILDLNLTLEYLETHGVPVIGFRTDEFPAFYTRSSGLGVDYRYDEIQALAQAVQLHWEMQLGNGIVIANPIPNEYAMPPDRIERAIERALEEAQQKNIHGKAVTPFLLARVEQLTGGDSLVSNVELVLHNARLGAELAVKLSLLQS